MLKRIFFLLVIQTLFIGHAFAQSTAFPDSFLSFDEAEKLAVQNSPTIISYKYKVDSAEARTYAQKAQLLPIFSFSASSMFQTKIGEFSIPQLSLTRDVGDHLNWSVGPEVNWVVWDTGQILNKARSLKKIADSESQNLDYNKRQVILNARVSYVNTQLAKAQVLLVRDALKLARSQYSYVLQKKEAGTADLFDLTVAHQEMVDREKDLETAEGNLAVAKRTLVAALGFEPEIENCDSLDVEPIEAVLNKLIPKSNVSVDIEAHPKVQSLADQKRSAELAARSSIAQYFPEVTLNGQSTYQYPNFGVNNTIQQNQLTLGLSIPILDWGIINKESKSFKYTAHSAGEEKKQAIINLSRETSEIRENIETFKRLRLANARVVKDAVEVARLSFDSYKAGRIIFLDVQRANVKELATKVTAADNDANLAIQISNLLALAESGGGL